MSGALVPIRQLVEDLLQKLPRDLYYHDISHTLQDVFPLALEIGGREGCTERDLVILGAAALFHDVGYLDRYETNEPIGAQYARETLPNFGFTEAEIARVDAAILATAIPQSPNEPIGEILCDADLGHLGMPNFFLRSDGLRRELRARGQRPTKRSWIETNIRFLEQHEYFTATATAILKPGKKRNLELTRLRLRAFPSE